MWLPHSPFVYSRINKNGKKPQIKVMKKEMIVKEFKVGLFRTPVTVSCDINGENVRVESPRKISKRHYPRLVGEIKAKAMSARVFGYQK